MNSKTWVEEIKLSCQGSGLVQMPLVHGAALPSPLQTPAMTRLNTNCSFTLHPLYVCTIFPIQWEHAAHCQGSGLQCCREESSSAAALPFVIVLSVIKAQEADVGHNSDGGSMGMDSSDVLGAVRVIG